MEVAGVSTAGISKVSDVDFEYAKTLKSTIKLIGTASLNADGSLAVFVSPTMVLLVNYFLADMICVCYGQCNNCTICAVLCFALLDHLHLYLHLYPLTHLSPHQS